MLKETQCSKNMFKKVGLICIVLHMYLTVTQSFLSIKGDNFYINGHITYNDSSNNVTKGLLMNSRMIQGIFDDANASTVNLWEYPDTHKWDPWRNTMEFIGNMSIWKSYGLLAFTVGMQGIF